MRKNLRKYRIEKNMSQKQVAEYLGVSERMYSLSSMEIGLVV